MSTEYEMWMLKKLNARACVHLGRKYEQSLILDPYNFSQDVLIKKFLFLRT